VDQHLPAWVPVGIEIEAAFVGPPWDIRADVADQKLVVERAALERDTELLANPAGS
jgi:hypothetical protein